MNASGWHRQSDGQQWSEHAAYRAPPPVQPDADAAAVTDNSREARRAQALHREDWDDQEDGLLTVVTFVVIGLCIIIALAIYRA
jgi:hypothetical protein